VADATDRLQSGLPRLEPGSVFAGYRIESLLDRGGMGVLYRATDLDLDRVVALKIIAPEHTQNETAIARFKAEARLAASLEHPNIVPIHRGGEENGVLYLAMRYVPGTNLRRVVDRGPMALERIDRIIGEIADALDAAHAKGLVHRDVKPANILVCGEGDQEHVYLTDFGLTKRVGSAAELTRAGAWVGTPDYVAPEQIQGHKVDRRADVYSLGCVLYEMLTGHVAYPKQSDMAKLWAHVTDPPPLPRGERPELAGAFDDVVARATAKDPEERYATAGELAAAVHAAVGEQVAHEAGQLTNAPDQALSATRADLSPAGPALAAADPEAPAPPATPEPAAAGAPAAPATPTPPPPTPQPGGVVAPVPAPRGRGRRRAIVAGLLAVAAAAIAAAVVVLTSSGSSGAGSPRASHKPAIPGLPLNGDLAPVPTNHVNGVGDAVVHLDGTLATVSVRTNGLLDAAPHAMHIHAGARGECPPGRAAKPHGGHLAIGTLDGVPWYGPPVTALTTRGDTTVKKSLLAFTRFPRAGNIRYTRAIRVSKVIAAEIRSGNAVVVVHGIDWNRNGIYDNAALDRSDLKRSLPGEITAPALCGPLVPQKPAGTAGARTTGQVGAGKGMVLTAALSVTSSAPSWVCHLLGIAPAPGDRAA
jgi:hypothetical protein